MLATDCGPLEALKFPLIASPKLDGVRAIISAEGVLSRSLKLIPNREVQAALEGLPIGLDGELIAGDPCAPDAYRRTVSMVMSEDADITGLHFFVFDIQTAGPFSDRHSIYTEYVKGLVGYDGAVVRVPQYPVNSLAELIALEDKWIGEGFEGVILRKPDSPYKHGRSTRKEGYLLKLKRFQDSEAEVLGVTELMHNGNEAKKNALGHTERSSHKAGLTGSGVLGTLRVKDVKTGVEFEIGTGFTAKERKDLWEIPLWQLQHKLVKYKFFPVGVKDKPRHPVFLGWRDRIDT